jgi:hypothetical protein
MASSSLRAAVAGAAAGCGAMLPPVVLSLLQLMFMFPIILRTVCCQMF